MRLSLLLLLALAFSPFKGTAADVLHLKNGKTVAGQVDQITLQAVAFRYAVDLGQGRRGEVKRSIRLEDIEFIDFGRSEREVSLLKQGGKAVRVELQKLWDEKGVYLGQPRSSAGEIGLLYAEVLLAADSVYHWNRAMDLYDLIEAQSWSEQDKRRARVGRIRAYMVLGKLGEAAKAAGAVIAGSGDEGMIIEAQLLSGDIGFLQLKELQRENPKWDEDDELRPERNRIYHGILDHYLNVFLFHGTWEQSAAEGLMAAAEVYRFAGDSKGMERALQDVVQIYAATPTAIIAIKELEKLKELKTLKNEKNHDEK